MAFDFPNAPTVGATFNAYTWDGEKWTLTGTSGSAIPPSTANPHMDGTAAPGTATPYSREDHVHPSDTSRATTAYVDAADALRAPLASPVFTGDPRAPTATVGDSDTSIATTAFVAAAVAAGGGGGGGVFTPQGQCILQKSGANLILLPFKGNLLTVNGVNCTIPDAGVTLAPTGLTVGQLYYIYATASGGVVTGITPGTTAHARSTTAGNKGVEIASGSDALSLVGMAMIITGPAWVDTPAQRFVANWFNRVPRVSLTGVASHTMTSSTPTEINTAAERAQTLAWAGTDVACALLGYGSCPTGYAVALAPNGNRQVHVVTSFTGAMNWSGAMGFNSGAEGLQYMSLQTNNGDNSSVVTFNGGSLSITAFI